METRLFDYELPEARIAQHPLADRSASRLCVVSRDGLEHARFADFAERVSEGALVVLNDTRVLRARLLGTRRGTGGRVELLLVRRVAAASERDETWVALGRASKPLRVGTIVDVGALDVEIVEPMDDSSTLRVRCRAEESVAVAIERCGHVPLPPYMRRPDDEADATRYQTVFARNDGSVAAPTAALHLTEDLLARLVARGVELGFVTLHVGPGTFRPVSAEDLDAHPMHEEYRVVGPDLAEAVRRARARNAPVVAVGTTVVRALESSRDPGNPRYIVPTTGDTRLLIQPGYAFGPVDALLTNFHMPKSTLLALVSAFAGRERILGAYRDALEQGYRFLSYGDSMWIPERLE